MNLREGNIFQLCFPPNFHKNRESAIDLPVKKAYNKKKIQYFILGLISPVIYSRYNLW